jgi:hypothetical protein
MEKPSSCSTINKLSMPKQRQNLKELFINLGGLSFDGVLIARLLLVNKGKLKPFEFQSVDNNFISRILF